MISIGECKIDSEYHEIILCNLIDPADRLVKKISPHRIGGREANHDEGKYHRQKGKHFFYCIKVLPYVIQVFLSSFPILPGK
jgi:hypothetical protein